jgi:peptidoglycan/xylan/chitin deacetylase (PgdA/CDA1 family)
MLSTLVIQIAQVDSDRGRSSEVAMSDSTLRRHRSFRRAVGLGAVVAVFLLTVQVSAPPVGWDRVEPAAAQVVPATQAAASAVALAADPGGFSHAFYRGQDTAVFTRTVQDGVWSGQTSLGGRILGAPSAALAGSTLVVAARGMDSGLWVRVNRNGMWGDWQDLGGILSSAPAVAVGADGGIDAFARGTDDQLWTRTMAPDGTLSVWTALNGVLATGPAAVTVASGRLDVYVAGSDHSVWRRTRSAGGWSWWEPLGGLTYSAPSAAPSPQGTDAWVVVRGLDNGLYLNAGMGGAWSGWQPLGGVLIDAPGASGGSGGVDVVVRGTDNALWSLRHRSGAWSDWSQAWAPAPPPAPSPSLLGVDWTRIPTSAPVVALTFDAGANADAVPSILQTLKTKNVPATFFLTGQWVRSFPAQTNAIAVGGYLVGNHSDTHPALTTLSDAQVRAEVENAQWHILVTGGAETRPLFRFPFGDVDARVLGIVNGLGYVGVRWTVDTLGWQGTSGGMTVQRVVDRVLAGLQPGEIVLMHVGSHPTDRSMLDAAALPQIIDQIRARGYEFVTLTALTG